MKKQFDSFLRNTLRVDASSASVSDTAILALMDSKSEEAAHFAEVLTGSKTDASAIAYASVLATMLAANQRKEIRISAETGKAVLAPVESKLGVHGSVDTTARFLDGIGEYGTFESFLAAHRNPMGVNQIVNAAIGLWESDGFAKALTVVPCVTPVISFHTPIPQVRTLASASKPINALDVLRDPSKLDGPDGDKLALRPINSQTGLANGVFPTTTVADLAAICAPVGGVATYDYTDVLSSAIELKKVYVTLKGTKANDDPLSLAGYILIDSGMFTQLPSGSTADRALVGHIPMILTKDNTAGLFGQAGGPAEGASLVVTVSPNIMINLDDRKYTPSCSVKTDDEFEGEAITFDITGYDIAVMMAQDNMRRNIYRVEVSSRKREYAIPQGTQILIDNAITEATMRGAELMKVATSVSRARLDHNALNSALNVSTIHKLALTNAGIFTDMEHPSMRYPCAGKSRTAVRKFELELADTICVDHSSQRKAVEARVINAVLGAVSECYSESLMHASLENGESIIWQATATPEVRAACLTFPSCPTVDGLIDIGMNIKLQVITSSDVLLGENILIAPKVLSSGENAKVLSYGIVADCGAGFYQYQGGDGGSHTQATAVVDRASFIPCNPTVIVIDVKSRTDNAYSPGKGNAA